MPRFALRRPWCLLAWSSLLLLDPALAQARGDVIVVAPGDRVNVRPPRPGVDVEAAVDGGPLQTVPGSVLAPTTPGAHWLAVASRGQSGALSPVRWTRLIVDSEGPWIRLDIEPEPSADDQENQWIPPGARARAHATDKPAGVARLSLAIDGATTERESATVEMTLPASGAASTGTVSVDAASIDTVGNQTTRATLELRIDATPPTGTIEIEGPRVETDTGWVLGPTSRLTAVIDDAESGLETTTHWADGEIVDEARWAGAWLAGSRRASIRARDRVGNESVIGPLAFAVDDAPPMITWTVAGGVTNDAGERYHRSPVAVTVTAEDVVAGVATLERLADETWHQVSEPVVVEGPWLELRARDWVGNETTERATWQVDDTAPTIQLRSEQMVISENEAVLTAYIGDTLTVVVADAESGVDQATYRLNHQGVPGRRAKRLVDGTPLVFEASGTHTLRVEARDQLGHEAVAQWRIEVAGRR